MRIRITEEDVESYERELARELPRFKVCYKDESALQRLIGKVVWPFNRTYMTNYTTVMFGRVYFPTKAWRDRVVPQVIYETLRHEAVHLRDARRFPIVFQLSYLFLLPAVFSARAIWELRAYSESIRVHAEIWGKVPDSMLQRLEDRFAGPDYFYMCPFRGFVRRWLERARAEALASLSD